MVRRRRGLMALMAVGVAVGWAGLAAATGYSRPSKTQVCEARKLEAAGEKAECLLEETADQVLGKTPNFAKCSAKFTQAFAKAEAKAGPGICPTEGDAAAIEAQIDACVADLANALSGSPPAPCAQFPATGQTTCYNSSNVATDCVNTSGQDGNIRAGATLSYTVNDDGTITDNNTGLMWGTLCNEEPNPSAGTTCPIELDVDEAYTWADAFAVHIAALNNTCDGAGITPCTTSADCGVGEMCGFAGYRDWRLPNVKELQSIVNHENFDPAVSLAFNNNCVANCSVPNCSCTRAASYWSSTSVARVPTNAWTVFFGSGGGTVDVHNPKTDLNHVRAVRGGL